MQSSAGASWRLFMVISLQHITTRFLVKLALQKNAQARKSHSHRHRGYREKCKFAWMFWKKKVRKKLFQSSNKALSKLKQSSKKAFSKPNQSLKIINNFYHNFPSSGFWCSHFMFTPRIRSLLWHGRVTFVQVQSKLQSFPLERRKSLFHQRKSWESCNRRWRVSWRISSILKQVS